LPSSVCNDTAIVLAAGHSRHTYPE
jgi:hypothetical protein